MSTRSFAEYGLPKKPVRSFSVYIAAFNVSTFEYIPVQKVVLDTNNWYAIPGGWAHAPVDGYGSFVLDQIHYYIGREKDAKAWADRVGPAMCALRDAVGKCRVPSGCDRVPF